MKKWSARAAIAALAVALCLCLTGCYRINTAITVNSDGSLDVGLDEAISKQALEQMSALSSAYGSSDSGSAFTDALSSSQEEYAAEGWTVTPYEDDSYQGAKMTYHIADLKSVSTSEGTLDAWTGISSSDTYSTSQDETASSPDQMTYFYYDESAKTYTLRMDVSSLNGMAAAASASASSSSSDSSSAYSLGASLGSSMVSSLIDEFSITVTLPTAPISSNATSVSNDGKTLTWTYDATTDKICDSDYIECTFSMENVVNWVPIAIGIGVVLVIVIIVIIIILSRKRKTGANGTASRAAASQAASETRTKLDNLTTVRDRELQNLQQLRDRGIITDVDYTNKRADILYNFDDVSRKISGGKA